MAINPITRTRQMQTGFPRLTSRPVTFGEHCLNSGAVWLALMAYWAVVALVLTLFPPGGRPIQTLTWQTYLFHRVIFTLAGLAAIWAMHRTGFPAAWDARIPARRRLLLPTLVGVVGGLLAIGIEVGGGAMKTMEGNLGTSLTVAFPGSLLFYSAGAISVEMVYLLVPVPLLLWLISNVILRGRRQTPTFWALAVISSAAEPLLQGSLNLGAAEGELASTFVALYVGESFAHNLASAYFFRRYGLLAAILVRLGHYMVWHVAYGNFLA